MNNTNRIVPLPQISRIPPSARPKTSDERRSELPVDTKSRSQQVPGPADGDGVRSPEPRSDQNSADYRPTVSGSGWFAD